MSRAKTPFGLAARLTFLVGILLLSIFGATTWLSFRVAERGTITSLERQGDAIASTLNHAFEVLVDQDSTLQLQRVAMNTLLLPDVRRVTVVDKGGKVLACTDRRALGKRVRSERLTAKLAQGEFASFVEHEGNEIIFLRPLFSGRYASGTDAGFVGAVEVVMDRRAMQAAADDTALGLLGIQLGGYAFLSLLVAFALRSLVTKPLNSLHQVAQKARAGDRAARSFIRTNDEIGVVAEAFDELAEAVERTLNTLESKVAARTRSLEKEAKARKKALSALERAHAETNQVNAALLKAKAEIEQALVEKSRVNEELKIAKVDVDRALVEKSRVHEELQVAKIAVERALAEKSQANEELAHAKSDLEKALDDSLEVNQALARANEDVEIAHERLVSSMKERLRLAETIRELSTPVIRVHRGILTMPIVGSIDEARAEQIQEELLAGIERHDANDVILDLTGVPFVDMDVARALVRARRCAELVGARVTLVGLKGDVAKSVVRAGLDLSGMVTLANLEMAILRALGRAGLEIRPMQLRGRTR